MRDVRFRAWDIKAEAMWYSDSTNEQEYCRTVIPAGGILYFEYGVYRPYQADGEAIDDVSQEGFEPLPEHIMQFTGLKDKNGSCIYEGDIVLKHYDKETYKDREPKIGIIKWVDFGARFTHEGIGQFKSYDEIYENVTNDDYPRSPFEVIGNIYQNPDLLNQR